jgi:hypothetical protein
VVVVVVAGGGPSGQCELAGRRALRWRRVAAVLVREGEEVPTTSARGAGREAGQGRESCEGEWGELGSEGRGRWRRATAV